MRRRSPDNTRPESARFRQAVKLVEIAARAKAAVKTPAKTPAQRQAELVERRKAAGLVLLKEWAHPEDIPAIRTYAARLAKRRERARKEAK